MQLVQKRILRLATAVLAVIIESLSIATPGTVDPSFNGGSVARVSIGETFSVVDAAIALPGNKLLVIGRCSIESQDLICTTRLTENGSVDSAYGTNGVLTHPQTSPGSFMLSFAMQRDGKLVGAGVCSDGSSGYQFCARRFLANGQDDPEFGISGRALAPSNGTNNGAWDMALQADGKIVMAGQCLLSAPSIRFCLVRLNGNGTIDTSFGTNGFATNASGAGFQAKAVAIQLDTKIVVTGNCRQSGLAGNVFCVQRYLENGSIDLAFGISGEALALRSDLNPIVGALAVQPDSKYIVLGSTHAARFTSNGALDVTFGVNGVAGSFGVDSRLDLQPNGKILSGCTSDFCVVRFHEDGRIDNGFGQLGYARTVLTVGATRGATVRALLSDGRISVASLCTRPDDETKRDLCAIRYLGGPYDYENCKPDLDGDGVFSATVDALIFARIAVGMTGEAVLSGLTFPANATRNDWPKLRSYLGTNCGLKLP